MCIVYVHLNHSMRIEESRAFSHTLCTPVVNVLMISGQTIETNSHRKIQILLICFVKWMNSSIFRVCLAPAKGYFMQKSGF